MSKRVLITGATSGIGEATAKYLHAQGYNLLLTGRNEAKLSELKSIMNDAAEVVPADLTDSAEIPKIFALCEQKGLKLDGLVHSAGIKGNLPAKLCNTEMLRSLMQVHFFAFMELCKLFFTRKISNNGASIVAVSSISSIIAPPTLSPYACAKSAVDTAVEIMSKEFIKRKIRVNTVNPADVLTPLISRVREDIYDFQPLGYIEPEHIAFTIEFLLSDKAKYITGAHIPISAGMNF